MKTSLPSYARLPINRCNLPAVILGSLSFQQHPTGIRIDGIHDLHKALFTKLNKIKSSVERAEYFMDYMTVHFRMHKLEDAGLMKSDINKRKNADYLRMLRGWLFDADSREGAVLKSWVESRFGLLPRYHKDHLKDYSGDTYLMYLQERASGLYATNAVEAQFDLLYSYCQFELEKKYNPLQLLTLYRGINRIDNYEIITQYTKSKVTVLLNNLNSFTINRERAGEFGDYILEVPVPWQKILFYSSLLPSMLTGEEEALVIGGVYEANISL